jgi:hypothetical protein
MSDKKRPDIKKRPGDPVWEKVKREGYNEKPGETAEETLRRTPVKIYIAKTSEGDDKDVTEQSATVSFYTALKIRDAQALSKQAAKGGKGKKGHLGPLAETLKAILQKLPHESRNLSRVLAYMDDDHEMQMLVDECGLPASTFDVDYENKVVGYLIVKSDQLKEATFKTIENHISSLK